jgi:hypothetical protein
MDSSNLVSLMLDYGAASTKFNESLAALGNRIANQDVPFADIRALGACRLVPLDKKPGVRPIGIGNDIRRLLAKAMAELTGVDLETVLGTDQLCIRMPGATEAGIHALREVFAAHDKCDKDASSEDWETRMSDATSESENEREDDIDTTEGQEEDTGWTTLNVDADNGFNEMRVAPALWSARLHWPRCSRFLFNLYRGYTTLFVYHRSGKITTILRKEGITQGCPLSMHLYGLGSLPLIRELSEYLEGVNGETIQVWFADDSSASGPTPQVKGWYTLLCERGPKYGYHPQPRKTVAATRPTIRDRAMVERLFWPEWPDLQITHGNKYLGGYVGSQLGDEYGLILDKKIQRWTRAVKELTTVAISQPQAAYRIMIKHLYPEMHYLQRVTPTEECSYAFGPITRMIEGEFIPALLGAHRDVIGHLTAFLRLPTRYGGLALPPTDGYADIRYATSKAATSHLVDALLNKDVFFSPEDHRRLVKAARSSQHRTLDEGHKEYLLGCMADDEGICPPQLSRALTRARQYRTHGFLHADPVLDSAFVLSCEEFRAGLSIRYLYTLPDLPAGCDGCKKPFSVRHGLSCPHGGMVIRRHNAVRNFFASQVADLLGGLPCIEPVIREADADRQLTGLVGDWSAQGFWSSQRLAFFDTRVIDTDAASYVNRPVASVLDDVAQAKKRQYGTACSLRHGSFTPVIMSVDGAMGEEATSFLRHLAAGLATKRSLRYCTVLGRLRQQLSCILVRGAGHCVYGPRRWVRSRQLNEAD